MKSIVLPLYFMFSHFLPRSYLLNYTHKIINLHNNPQFGNYSNCVICNNIKKKLKHSKLKLKMREYFFVFLGNKQTEVILL